MNPGERLGLRWGKHKKKPDIEIHLQFQSLFQTWLPSGNRILPTRRHYAVCDPAVFEGVSFWLSVFKPIRSSRPYRFFFTTGETKFWKISARFYVSTYRRRNGNLDITKCDIKLGRPKKIAIHPGWCTHQTEWSCAWVGVPLTNLTTYF
jgi:hypothetical protein